MIVLALLAGAALAVPDLPVVKLQPGGPGAMEGVVVDEPIAKPPARKKAVAAPRRVSPKATPKPLSLDPVSLSLVAVKKSGAWPKGVELTPDGSMAVTSDFSSNTLTLVSTSSLSVVGTVLIGKDSPVEIAFLPNGSAFITGGYERDRSFVFDVATRTVTRWIEGAKNRKFPKVPVVRPDGAEVWVSYWGSNTIGVIDSSTWEVKATIPVGRNPRGIAFTPDGKKAYVCNFCNACSTPSTVHVIDVETRKRTKIIKGLKQPRHAVTSPDGGAVYVSLLGEQKIVKIDTATDAVVSSVVVGKLPKTVKVSANGRYLFVANYGSDTIMVVDTTLMQVVTRVKAGRQPSGLSITPDGSRLWTTDWADGTIRIFDVAYPFEGPLALPAALLP